MHACRSTLSRQCWRDWNSQFIKYTLYSDNSNESTQSSPMATTTPVVVLYSGSSPAASAIKNCIRLTCKRQYSLRTSTRLKMSVSKRLIEMEKRKAIGRTDRFSIEKSTRVPSDLAIRSENTDERQYRYRDRTVYSVIAPTLLFSDGMTRPTHSYTCY